jgi:hypothetical protein
VDLDGLKEVHLAVGFEYSLQDRPYGALLEPSRPERATLNPSEAERVQRLYDSLELLV